MPIGEFGGAAALPGDGSPFSGDADVLVLRDGPRRAQSGARVRRRHAAVLQESRQSARAHHLRQVGRGGDSNCSSARRAATASPNGASIPPLVGGERVPVHITRVWERPFCRLLHFERALRARAAPAAAETADRRADVGPLRDAAARHGRGVPAQPRRLHHRMGRCPHGAARGGPLRSRRLHRLRHLDAACARRRHARHRRVPALGAGAGRGRLHGGRRRSLRAALDDADGRPDRHARSIRPSSTSSPSSAASTGSAATSSPRCRSRIRASCATSIRASCSSTAS